MLNTLFITSKRAKLIYGILDTPVANVTEKFQSSTTGNPRALKAWIPTAMRINDQCKKQALTN